jgi:hypothetical protein
VNARAVACFAAAVTGLAVVYTVGLLLGMPDPDGAHLARGLIHLGELAALVALGLSGAAGTGLLGRLGLGLGVLGALVLAVAEVTTVSAPATSETLFAIAPTLVGIGLVLAGIAVVRTGRWAGWRRWVALALGVYVFAVLTPLIITSGGPPAVPAVAGLLVWQVLWVLIAVAVLVETPRPALSRQPAR